MYSHEDIHARADVVLRELGYVWIEDRILRAEIPVSYWVEGKLWLRIKIVERQNTADVQFSRVQCNGALPPDAGWVAIATYWDEHRRRLGLSMHELMNLVPPKKNIDALEKLDAVLAGLPGVLARAEAA
jgi:hypothetical protein